MSTTADMKAAACVEAFKPLATHRNPRELSSAARHFIDTFKVVRVATPRGNEALIEKLTEHFDAADREATGYDGHFEGQITVSAVFDHPASLADGIDIDAAQGMAEEAVDRVAALFLEDKLDSFDAVNVSAYAKRVMVRPALVNGEARQGVLIVMDVSADLKAL